MIKNYKVVNALRPGAQGNIYVVEDQRNQERLVLKSTFIEPAKKTDFEKFVSIWKSLSVSCEHIVQFKDFFHEGTNGFVLMEYCENGDLDSLVKKKKMEGTKFSESEIAKITCHVFNGLRTMHSMNMIHRDIKSANILITRDGVYKIADFNVSCFLEKDSRKSITLTGTLGYIAPEIFQNKEYSFSADAYSFGAVLYELLALTPAFVATDIPSILANKYAPLDPALGYSTGLVQLVTGLLSLEPSQRPTATDVLANPLLERARMYGLEAKQAAQDVSVAALQATLIRLEATVAECMNGIANLTEALNAERRKTQALEATALAPPDFAHPTVVKRYDSATAGEFVAPENGWIYAEAHAGKGWVRFEVNGKEVASGSGDHTFWSADGHHSILYPLRKGDRYKIVNGSYHVLVFYPFVKYAE